MIKDFEEFKVWVEKLLNLYKITARCYMTTYHSDVERIGRLTGKYQHIHNGEWVEGVHPKFKGTNHENHESTHLYHKSRRHPINK